MTSTLIEIQSRWYWDMICLSKKRREEFLSLLFPKMAWCDHKKVQNYVKLGGAHSNNHQHNINGYWPPERTRLHHIEFFKLFSYLTNSHHKTSGYNKHSLTHSDERPTKRTNFYNSSLSTFYVAIVLSTYDKPVVLSRYKQN